MQTDEVLKQSDKYAITHNLVNRIYDMLYFFYFFKNHKAPVRELKDEIRKNLKTANQVETIAKYFDTRLKKKYIDVEVKCNLKNLITDLDYLKQYLVKELKQT